MVFTGSQDSSTPPCPFIGTSVTKVLFSLLKHTGSSWETSCLPHSTSSSPGHGNINYFRSGDPGVKTSRLARRNLASQLLV